MLFIPHSSKQHIDKVLRAYKRKVDETKLSSRFKNQMVFTKPSTRKRKKKTQAMYTQRYRLLHDLI